MIEPEMAISAATAVSSPSGYYAPQCALRFRIRGHRDALTHRRNALSGHRYWKPVWRTPESENNYDAVIIGAGGYGLATSYYLVKKHGIRNNAVPGKGCIGDGNTGRNTQVTRSKYFLPQRAAYFDHSLKPYENLCHDLSSSVMVSQRGVLNPAHSHYELESMRRWAIAIRINGIAVINGGSTLLVAEHHANCILSFDIADDGSLSNRQLFVRMTDLVPGPAQPSIWLGPDGTKVDPEGNIFVAHYSGGRVVKMSPAGGLL
jgi:hypothetical protein